MNRFLHATTLAVLVAFAPIAAGQAPTTVVPVITLEALRPAPEKSAVIVWHYEAVTTPGRWYSDSQVDNVALRIWTLEDTLAKQNGEMVRVTAEAKLIRDGASLNFPRWALVTAGVMSGLALGIGVSWYVWRASQPSAVPTAAGVVANPIHTPVSKGLVLHW